MSVPRSAVLGPAQPHRALPRLVDQPPGNQPRERLRAMGPRALSDAEVLALILNTGGREGVLALAARVLAAVGGPAGLARASERDLAVIPGIGPAKAAEIVAALELGRRAARALAAERPQITGPADAAAILIPRMAHLEHEEAVVLLLDRRHRLLREVIVGTGGISNCPLAPREVFAAALRHPGVAAILVAHNHPSGDPTPGADDKAITRRLIEGARLLGIDFVDHLVVASCGWTSLITSGLL